MSASCEVTQGVGDTWPTCPTLLRGIWDRSRRAGFRCWSWLSAHVWLPCCWGGRLMTPFPWYWALASKSGGIHPQLPWSAPLPLPATLHQHAWLLGRQHMHTFWGRWLAGQRCRWWREGFKGDTQQRFGTIALWVPSGFCGLGTETINAVSHMLRWTYPAEFSRFRTASGWLKTVLSNCCVCRWWCSCCLCEDWRWPQAGS